MELSWRDGCTTRLINIWLFIKSQVIYTGKKTASLTNGVGKTGCLHVEECKMIYNYHLHKTQVQVNSRPQHKMRSIEPGRRETEE